MDTAELKTKALEIVNQSKSLVEKIDELKEWDSFAKVLSNISSIVAFVTGVVVTVENVVTDFKGENVTGEAKLEAASQILDELIRGNIWFEIVDKYIFKIIISMVVHYLNEKYGHTWLMDAPE